MKLILIGWFFPNICNWISNLMNDKVQVAEIFIKISKEHVLHSLRVQ